MADVEPRYGFSPLERRGLLLGLQSGQLAGIAAGVVVGLVVRAAAPRPVSTPIAVSLTIAVAAGCLWVRDGRPAWGWAAAWLGWVARRGRGIRLHPAPTAGRRVSQPLATVAEGATIAEAGAGKGPASRTRYRHRPGPRRATAVPGVDLLADAGAPGQPDIGVIRDRWAHTWAAAVPVTGRSFTLLDPLQQAQRLEQWRSVLGAAARPGGPVVRLQWLHRSGVPVGAHPGSRWPEQGPEPAGTERAEPDPAVTLDADAAGGRPADDPPDGCRIGAGAGTDARSGYLRLLSVDSAGLVGHDTWIVLSVSADRRRGPAGGAPVRFGSVAGVATLRRELRLLDGQMRAADLEPGAPLDLPALAALMAGEGPAPAGSGSDRAWPMAVREDWSVLRTDGSWHCTYWVAEWPRVEVGPDFLTPLLIGPARRRVSVVMAPVPGDKAMREARSARTADLADAELRSRAGFLSSARRDREAEGVTRREEELAAGHSEFRFSGYVTVSASDSDALAEACADVEHSAQSARLELRRLHGRQSEAYTWTLPIARGLR